MNSTHKQDVGCNPAKNGSKDFAVELLTINAGSSEDQEEVWFTWALMMLNEGQGKGGRRVRWEAGRGRGTGQKG